MSISYYESHGSITNPGIYADKLHEIPTNLSSLCKSIQGLILHPFMPPNMNIAISETRFSDMKLRYVNQMIEKILELDNRPLIFPRLSGSKIIGTSRDFATFLCSVLRGQGIPARVRYGFSRYFDKNFLASHVVCEYWSIQDHQWIKIDSQLDFSHREYYQINFDPINIPNNQFVLAGDVWKQFRTGSIDLSSVGLSISEKPRGLTFITSILVYDLFSLNKIEPLTSDEWEIGNKENLTSEEIKYLDKIAKITTEPNLNLKQINSMINDPIIKPLSSIE